MRVNLPLFAILLVSLALGACGESSTPTTRIRLTTTTSTRDSGLLAAILPAFEQAHGVRVDVVGVGTGQALALGRQGEGDIVLVHARAREEAFVTAGHGLDRRDIMWNDFVIAGPASDPAGIQGMSLGRVALKRIAATEATFVSRGDDSGTHIRELELWKSAGGLERWAAYLSAGQGMGACLTIADEKQAYILADRGTLRAHRGELALVVLVEGDPALRNPYGAMLVNPERHPHTNATGARALLDYLTSEACQQAIGDYRVDGHVLFHPHRED